MPNLEEGWYFVYPEGIYAISLTYRTVGLCMPRRGTFCSFNKDCTSSVFRREHFHLPFTCCRVYLERRQNSVHVKDFTIKT